VAREFVKFVRKTWEGTNMAYLTFLEYGNFGGTVTESTFDILEPKARRKLDYFTQNRLQTATTIISEVKELMAEFINRMQNKPVNGNVTSYSNGIESFGFKENQNDALNKELYQMAVEYLPIELITQYVESASEV
jgi:hypothetical protein